MQSSNYNQSYGYGGNNGGGGGSSNRNNNYDNNDGSGGFSNRGGQSKKNKGSQQQSQYNKKMSRQNDYDRKQQLMNAAREADSDALQELMEKGNKFSHSELNKALHATVQGCMTSRIDEAVQCINKLLNFGANINAEDDQSKTPLMIACEKGYIELVQEILDKDDLVDHKDTHKRTALFYAIDSKSQNVDVALALIRKGADVNAQAIDGKVPLLVATQKKYSDIVKLLLQEGADVMNGSSDGNTALHMAVGQHDLKIVQILVESTKQEQEDHAILFAQNKNKEKPVQMAEKIGDIPILNYLKEKHLSYEQKSQIATENLLQEATQEELLRQKRKTSTKNTLSRHQSTSNQYDNDQAAQLSDQSAGDRDRSEDKERFYTPEMTQSQIENENQDKHQNPKNIGKQQQQESPKQVKSWAPLEQMMAQHQQQQQQQKPQQSTNKKQNNNQQSNSGNNNSGKKQQQTNNNKQSQQKHNQQQQQQQNNQQQSSSSPSQSPSKTVTQAAPSQQQNKKTSQQQQQIQSTTNANMISQQKQSKQQLDLINNNIVDSSAISDFTPQNNNQSSTLSDPSQVMIPNNATANTEQMMQQQQQVPPEPVMLQQQINFQQTFMSNQKQMIQKGMDNLMRQQPNTSKNSVSSNNTSNPQTGANNNQRTSASSAAGQTMQNPALFPPQFQVPYINNTQNQYPMPQTPASYQACNPAQFSTIPTPQSSSQQTRRMPPMQTAPTLDLSIINNAGQQQQQAPIFQLPISLDLNLSTEKDQQIFILQQKLLEKDDTIAKKNQELDEKEQQINNLIRQNQQNEHQVKMYEKYCIEYHDLYSQSYIDLIYYYNMYKHNETNCIIQQQQKVNLQKVSMNLMVKAKDLNNHLQKREEDQPNKKNTPKKNRQQIQAEEKLIKELEASIDDFQQHVGQLLHQQEYETKSNNQDNANANQSKQASSQVVATTNAIAPPSSAQSNNPIKQQAISGPVQKSDEQLPKPISTFNYPHKTGYLRVPQLFKENQNLITLMEHRFEISSNQVPVNQLQNIYNKLHTEITEFKRSVDQILEEMKPIKQQLIQKITQVIQTAIPGADIQAYGSHATGLCLHWSDIDLVLIPPSSNDLELYGNKNLESVCNELQKDSNCSWVKSCRLIGSTKVPVIKLECNFSLNDPNSPFKMPQGYSINFAEILERPFKVDITQTREMHNGIECVNLVKEYLQESEVIAPLILVLKQILKVWKFNDPYYGGLSSYGLFLMIVAYLQKENTPNQVAKVNLGKLLLEFMMYYGQFESENTTISCSRPGRKGETINFQQIPENYKMHQLFMGNSMSHNVFIQDPLDSNNNVAQSSFKFDQIKKIMQFTHFLAFTGCFCDCHADILPKPTLNEYNQFEQSHEHKLPMPLPTPQYPKLMASQQRKRQCDSILCRLIYGYQQYTHAFESNHISTQSMSQLMGTGGVPPSPAI